LQNAGIEKQARIRGQPVAGGLDHSVWSGACQSALVVEPAGGMDGGQVGTRPPETSSGFEAEAIVKQAFDPVIGRQRVRPSTFAVQGRDEKLPESLAIRFRSRCLSQVLDGFGTLPALDIECPAIFLGSCQQLFQPRTTRCKVWPAQSVERRSTPQSQGLPQ
jgi:hypothetical protein